MSYEAAFTPADGIGKYNPKIKNVYRENDKIKFVYKNETDESIDERTALLMIIAGHDYYLSHKGKKPECSDILSDPRIIFPKGFISNGKPILSIDDTLSVLKRYTYLMCMFKNKKCREYTVSWGIGYTVFKLYEPYKDSDNMELHRQLVALTGTGAYIFQLSNKPLSRAFYKGLYTAWDAVRTGTHNFYFYSDAKPFDGLFDDLLKNEDVFDDPIHNPKLYPSNLSSYSVDNLFFIWQAVMYARNNEKKYNGLTDDYYIYSICFKKLEHFFKEFPKTYRLMVENAANYSKLSDIIYALYHQIYPANEKIRKSSDINLDEDKFYKLLDRAVDLIPYAGYTLNMCIVGTPCVELETYRFGYEKYAFPDFVETSTKRDLTTLDFDCPIMGEYERQAMIKGIKKDKLLKKTIGLTIGLAVGIPLLIYLTGVAQYFWNEGGHILVAGFVALFPIILGHYYFLKDAVPVIPLYYHSGSTFTWM